jgi:hypothetical protein
MTRSFIAPLSLLIVAACGNSSTGPTITPNVVPTVSDVQITPETVTADSTLTCGYTFEDADGDADASSVRWFVEGLEVGTGATLVGVFAKGDMVSCEVTPFDGTDEGTPAVAEVMVGNIAPSAPGVQITPDVAEAGVDDLLCGVTTASVDADGDAVAYTIQWTADGLAYPDEVTGASGPETTSLADDTVPAADTGLADTWVCEVVADDGVDMADTAQAARDVLGPIYYVGESEEHAGGSSHASNYLLGQKLTLDEDASLEGFGVITKSPDAVVRFALYADGGGFPTNLLVESEASEPLLVGVNEVGLLSDPVDLAAGDYWVMAVYAGRIFVGEDPSTQVRTFYRAMNAAADMPATFGGGSSYMDNPFNYYVIVR